MEKFRYTKEWEDRCRQSIGWKENCVKCLFENLCLFQQNQERIWKDVRGVEKISEKKW